MMMSHGLWVFLLVAHVTAYKSGAPETVCDSMLPEHHSTPKTDPSPYTITPKKFNINAGESVEVTLSGTENTKFRGYFIQARVGDTPIGKFEKGPEIKLVDCGSGVGVREESIKFLAKAASICKGTMTDMSLITSSLFVPILVPQFSILGFQFNFNGERTFC